MAIRRFIQCDVFSNEPAKGNALAVVVDAEGLSTQMMHQFAAWMNIAETAFILPPDDARNDYKIRIMTPGKEIPFAGHPTLGACLAWLHCGGQSKTPGIVRQECAVGIIDIHVSGRQIEFEAPATKIDDMAFSQRAAIQAVLGLSDSEILATAQLEIGPVLQVFQLKSAAAVLALDSSQLKWPKFLAVGFFGAHPPEHECDYEVRMFAPSSGMTEDPITGSLNAAIGCWLKSRGELKQTQLMSQGAMVNRDGRVLIRKVGDRVRVSGDVQILIEGALNL